jgi:transcriptional regulator with XRE-family HTH domain
MHFMLDGHIRTVHIVAMTLTEYLRENSLSETAFADRAGISQSQVNRLRSGKCRPSFEAIEAIKNATDGRVSPNDWFAEAAE